eukprot:m.184590 g.184590  ORF g.184590 m.184590 type:complete len:441 (+) comp14717_c0_seq2:234-1556(+)
MDGQRRSARLATKLQLQQQHDEDASTKTEPSSNAKRGVQHAPPAMADGATPDSSAVGHERSSERRSKRKKPREVAKNEASSTTTASTSMSARSKRASIKTLNADIVSAIDRCGQLVPKIGNQSKYAVMHMLAAGAPFKFNLMSGIQSFQNAIVLFLNVGTPSPKYPNQFFMCGQRVTYFASPSHSETTPVIQDLLACLTSMKQEPGSSIPPITPSKPPQSSSASSTSALGASTHDVAAAPIDVKPGLLVKEEPHSITEQQQLQGIKQETPQLMDVKQEVGGVGVAVVPPTASSHATHLHYAPVKAETPVPTSSNASVMSASAATSFSGHTLESQCHDTKGDLPAPQGTQGAVQSTSQLPLTPHAAALSSLPSHGLQQDKAILLFGRFPNEPYLSLGRLVPVEVDVTVRPIKFVFALVDHALVMQNLDMTSTTSPWHLLFT